MTVTAEHTHHWQVDRMQAGFSCPCGQSGWDWHVDEVKRLKSTNERLNAMVVAGFAMYDDTEARDVVDAAAIAKPIMVLTADNARLRAELQTWQQRFGDCEATVLRQEALIRKHYPTIAGHVMRLQEGHESRSAAEWLVVAQDFANEIFASAASPEPSAP